MTAPTSPAPANMPSPSRLRFIDIAINLTDPMFRGNYHGKRKHADDLVDVLKRAKDAGVKQMVLTGGSLSESKEALELAQEHGFYSTAGLHPTRATEMSPGKEASYVNALGELIGANLGGHGRKGRIVAVGECGLDYDRLHFSPREAQIAAFRAQLSLASRFELPLFLHSRAAHADFVSVLRERAGDLRLEGASAGEEKGRRGVVHSFTGTVEEVWELVDMGLYIGVNGCSLKTSENLEMVKSIPLSRLLLETDAPWCTATSTHASHAHLQTLPADLRALYHPAEQCKKEKYVPGKWVKGRNEPAAIGAVAWVVAQVMGRGVEEVAEASWKNTVELFGLEVED